jgi:hypothetical protein
MFFKRLPPKRSSTITKIIISSNGPGIIISPLLLIPIGFFDEIEADKLKEHLNLEDKDANIVEIFDQTKESLNKIKRDIDK